MKIKIHNLAFLIVILIFVIEIKSIKSQVNVTPFSQNYSSLVSAFSAISGGYHGNGSITVIIYQNTNEFSSAVLNGNVFSSCLIRPQGARTVSGNFNEVLVVLDDADNVTIDGLNFSGNSLTLTNLNPGTLQGCIRLSNGASNNTIRNLTCNGYGFSTTQGGRTINVAQSLTSSGNDNNIIEYNTVNGGRRGIQVFGTAGLATNNNTVVRNNKVKNYSQIGIFAGSETIGTTVRNNEIFFDAIVSIASGAAMQVQGAGIIDISANRIHSLSNSPATFVSGIIMLPVLLTAPGSNLTDVVITNNMIAITPVNSTGVSVYGIELLSSTNSYSCKAYNNSILIAGSVPYANIESYGIVSDVSVSGSSVEVFNNLSVNNRTGGDAQSIHSAGYFYTLYASVNFKSDYNVYYSDDPVHGWHCTHNGYAYDALGRFVESNSGSDNNEFHTLFSNGFSFASQTDLHLIDLTVVDGINAVPTPLVTYDYDGLSRHVIHPYRGADEIQTEMLQLDLVSSFQGMSSSVETPLYIDLVLDDSAFSRFAKSSGITGSPNNRGAVVVVFFGPGILGFGAMFGIVVFNPFLLNTWGPCGMPTVLCFDPPATLRGGSAFFDFTYAISQAYGNNQILYNGVPSIYNGDVNQDMSIDLSDIISVFNSAQAFSSGYFLIDDITRDQIVDLTDLIIVSNNAANFVIAIAPGNKPLSRPSVSEVREVKKVNPKVNRLNL